MSRVWVRGTTLGVLIIAAVAGVAVVAPRAGAAASSSSCLLPDAVSEHASPPANDSGDAIVAGAESTLRPYVAKRIASTGCWWPAEVRAIVIDKREVRLQAGGRIVRRLPLLGVDSPGGLDLEALVDLVRDPDWVRLSDGVVTVAAAIVQAPNTEVTFGGGAVHEVRLLDLPYVGIIGSGATASFTDVTVTSWSASTDQPVLGHDQPRPFVHYDAGSRVDMADSVFAWLGSGAVGATGVTWGDGSGGTVVSTAFSNNFVGATASAPDALVFMFNAMTQNATDGLHVISGDSGATLDTNTIQGNGADGIVVSGASDSIVRNNHVWRNGRHGIVIEAGATRTSVIDNVVEPNGVDGVVLDEATASLVRGNVIGVHRSGVRLTGRGTDGNVVTKNVISGSSIGVRIESLPANNKVDGNRISDAAVAKTLHTTAIDPSVANTRAEDNAAMADASTNPDHQQLLGIGIVGVLLSLCGVSFAFVRRLVSWLRSIEIIDLEPPCESMGKADSVRTPAH